MPAEEIVRIHYTHVRKLGSPVVLWHKGLTSVHKNETNLSRDEYLGVTIRSVDIAEKIIRALIHRYLRCRQ